MFRRREKRCECGAGERVSNNPFCTTFVVVGHFCRELHEGFQNTNVVSTWTVPFMSQSTYLPRVRPVFTPASSALPYKITRQRTGFYQRRRSCDPTPARLQYFSCTQRNTQRTEKQCLTLHCVLERVGLLHVPGVWSGFLVTPSGLSSLAMPAASNLRKPSLVYLSLSLSLSLRLSLSFSHCVNMEQSVSRVGVIVHPLLYHCDDPLAIFSACNKSLEGVARVRQLDWVRIADMN